MTSPYAAPPPWVRALYLYALCFVANLVMLAGAVMLILGAITTAFPRTDPSPISSIGNAIIDVVEEAAPRLSDEPPPPQFEEGLQTARDAIDKQARNRGISRMVSGAAIFVAGLVAFLIAWKRADGGTPKLQTAPTGYPPQQPHAPPYPPQYPQQ